MKSLQIIILNGSIRLYDSLMINSIRPDKSYIFVLFPSKNSHQTAYQTYEAQKLSQTYKISIYFIDDPIAFMKSFKGISVHMMCQDLFETKKIIRNLKKYTDSIEYFYDFLLTRYNPLQDDQQDIFSNVFKKFQDRSIQNIRPIYKMSKNILQFLKFNNVDFGRIKGIINVNLIEISQKYQMPSQSVILKSFIKRQDRYEIERNLFTDLFSDKGPSYQSLFIEAGVISTRLLYQKVHNETYRKELLWKDFCYFYYKFNESVKNEGGIYNRKVKWHNNQYRIYSDLKRGRTQNSFINACIRQLKTQNYLPNRIRMIFANWCFQSGIDWRIARRLFEKYLIDFSEPSNTFGWLFSYNLTLGRPHNFNIQTQIRKYDRSEISYTDRFL